MRHAPYEPPFPHVGIGQDDDWVCANFTNAADILSVGYANWVDAQVGVDLTNGLYKFTATFPDDPPEATELIVGDLSVCVTNAGEYVFVLEKGVEYDFGTNPYDATVEYSMQDDLMDAPVFANGWWGDDNGVWTVDGDWHELYLPWLTYLGSCYWEPKFRGAPDVTNLSTADFPMTFTALLTDCCHTNGVTYHWMTDDEKVYIDSPYSQTTQVEIDSCFDAETFSLSVEAYAPDRTYYSTLTSDISTNDLSGLSFSMTAPEVVFLNDDDRTSRWYLVTFELSSSVATNATVSFMHSGNTEIAYSSDSSGDTPLMPVDIRLQVSDGCSKSAYHCYFACKKIGSGMFDAVCTMPGGKVLSSSRHYRAIEPLQKAICIDDTPDGRCYNPSCLIAGTNAWLKVGVNGSYSPDEVVWRVASGPARITVTNGWTVCVEPTANAGEVVIESSYGHDAVFQPRFVLPLAPVRQMTVCACVILDGRGVPVVTRGDIDDKIDKANRIFAQAGVEFQLVDPIIYLDDPSFLAIASHDLRTNANGKVVRYGISPQVTNMIAQINTSADIKMFWVESITDGPSLAFAVPHLQSCVIANTQTMTSSVVPHELGHVLGLRDIYAARKNMPQETMPQGMMTLYKGVVADPFHDWGQEEGRGYYESFDTHASMIQKLLMHGRDMGGKDIPYAAFEGYSSAARGILDLSYIPVGASNIKEVK